MTAFAIGDRVSHKKTGHTGIVLKTDGLAGRMCIIWEEKHWRTRQIYWEWRWMGIFRRAPPLVPPPSRTPPLPGPAAIMDGGLDEPN